MLKRLSILALLLSFGLLVAMNVLAFQNLRVDSGASIFDARFASYSASEARAFIAELGGQGVAFYLGTLRLLDSIFPPLFALGTAGLIWGGRRGVSVPLRLVLLVTPALYLWADLSENRSIAHMLQMANSLSDADVARTLFLTRLKWVTIGVSILLMVVLGRRIGKHI